MNNTIITEQPSMLRRLTLRRLVIAIIFIGVFVMAIRVPLDTDTFWHLRAGEWMVSEGRLLRTDIFSHTRAGGPWINHSYLSQLILYGAYSALGNLGLTLYVALLATAGMAFIYRLCSGNVMLRGFALILAASTATVFWSARPQMMSFLLSASVYYLLEIYLRGGRDRLWLLPPIILLWANLHAGFAIGFILIVLSLAGQLLNLLDASFKAQPISADHWQPIRRLIIIGLLSAVAVSINPYGPRMLLYPFNTVGIGVLRDFIQEWRSPDFHQAQIWPFAWMLLGLLALVGLSRRNLNWRELLLVTGTAYLALLAGRNIALFAIIAAPVVTHHLDDLLSERGWLLRFTDRPPRGLLVFANWLIMLLVLIAALAYLAVTLAPAAIEEARAESLPVAAVEYLNRQQPEGPIFNSYNWGGYLIWQARDYPVYVDGRTDLYGDELLRQYLSIYFALDDWQHHLDESGVNLILVEPNSPLARLLAQIPDDWTRTYSDQQAVIYSRR